MNSKITYRWGGIILLAVTLMLVVFDLGSERKVIVDEQPTEIPKEQQLEITQYIPLVKDHQWIYSINDDIEDRLLVSIDFFKNNVIQVRFDSDYKDVVKVYTLEEDGFYEVATIDDVTYKIDYTTTRQYKKTILKLPLEEGASWQLTSSEKATIEKVNEKDNSKLGQVNILEVNYRLEEQFVTVCYGEKIGVLDIQVKDGLSKHQITLEEVQANTTIKELVDVYYGNIEENTLDKVIQEVNVMTNEEPKHFLTDVLKITTNEPYLQTLPTEVVINNIFFDKEDGIVHIDLNEAYTTEKYSYKEKRLTLLSLANTVGDYYQAKYVKITVEGKNYQDYGTLYTDDKGIQVGVY